MARFFMPINETTFDALYRDRRWMLTAQKQMGASFSFLAEDAVQSSFLSLWKMKDEFRGDAPVEAYLYTILMRECRHLRSTQRRTATEELIEAGHPAQQLQELIQKDLLQKVQQQVLPSMSLTRRQTLLWWCSREYPPRRCGKGLSHRLHMRIAHSKRQLREYTRAAGLC